MLHTNFSLFDIRISQGLGNSGPTEQYVLSQAAIVDKYCTYKAFSCRLTLYIILPLSSPSSFSIDTPALLTVYSFIDFLSTFEHGLPVLYCSSPYYPIEHVTCRTYTSRELSHN